MRTKYTRIVVKDDTKELLHKCIDDFISKNPKLNGLRITEDHMVRRLCTNYLKW